jgi:DNA-binding IclR family transcriptional regulator
MQQMSKELRIPRPTLYRLLDALVDEGMLVRLDDGYHPGPKVLQWAAEVLNQPLVARWARPFLQSLADESGLTASIHVRMGNCRVCIARVEGTGVVRPHVRIGESLPLHVGASGRVLLAWLPDEVRQQYLNASYAQFPQHPLPSTAEAFVTVRAQGWALSLGERDEALASMSAPIFHPTGDVAAAISLSGVRQRFTDDKVPVWRDLVIHTAAQISRLLGAQATETQPRT